MHAICSLCIPSECGMASKGREGGHFWVFPAAESSWTEVSYSCSLLQQVVGSTVSHSLWQISKAPPLGPTPPKHHPLLPILLLALYFPWLPIFVLFPPVAPIKLFYLSPASPSTFHPSLLLSHISDFLLPNFSSKTHCCIHTFRSSGSHVLSAVSFPSATKRTKKKVWKLIKSKRSI